MCFTKRQQRISPDLANIGRNFPLHFRRPRSPRFRRFHRSRRRIPELSRGMSNQTGILIVNNIDYNDKSGSNNEIFITREKLLFLC
jgi:hypothetical protein